ERVVLGHSAVVVQPQDDTGQMIVVWLRPTKLIVGNARSKRSIYEILHHAAAPIVADDNEKFRRGVVLRLYAAAIFPFATILPLIVIIFLIEPLVIVFLEPEHAAIMVAAQRLSRIGLIRM